LGSSGLSSSSSVRVELGSEGSVGQSVLSVGVDRSLLGVFGSESRLNFSGVDDSGKIGVGDERSGSVVELIQFGEGILGPDDESSNVTSGSKLKKVQSVDVDEFDSGKISKSINEFALFRVDNEGSSSGNVSAISDFSVSTSNRSRRFGFEDIVISVHGFQESNSSRGLFNVGKGSNVDDQRDFSNSFDSVSSGKNQSGESRSCKSRSNCVSSLVDRGLSVPSSPDFSGGKHSSSSAHVSESSLSGSGSSSSRNSGNTSNGSSSSPRFGRSLMSSVFRDRVGLSVVLVQVFEDVLDNIGSDGCSQNVGESNEGSSFSSVVNGDDGS